jgi:hypothetical protein
MLLTDLNVFKLIMQLITLPRWRKYTCDEIVARDKASLERPR